MEVITNGLLIAATLFAGLYCWILARRVRRLQSLDSGLGAAIVTLTRQIELARATLEEARSGARETRQDLAQLTARADAASAQLRLLLAAAERMPVPAPLAAPSSEPLAARRREAAPGPRLVPDPDTAPEPEGSQTEDPASVPKPRRALSFEGLLRRRGGAEAAPDAAEADVVAALTALAAGGDR